MNKSLSDIMDASNYSPVNAKDAITVAAVKNDKTLNKTSNFGDVVDYVVYGSLEAGGMNGEISVSDGTSVSAAIVSGVAADVIADGNNDYASAVKAMDALDKCQCCDGDGRYTLSGEGSRAMRSPITPAGS